jgi:hypothetical protein
VSIGLLKNVCLLRCAQQSSLRRTKQYASFLLTSRALHPAIFEQPAKRILSITLYTAFIITEAVLIKAVFEPEHFLEYHSLKNTDRSP